MLDKLKIGMCRTGAPSLATSLEPLAHCSWLNWLNWVHFLILEGGLIVILINCMIFLSPFLDAKMMSISSVSILAQLNSGILCLQSTFV